MAELGQDLDVILACEEENRGWAMADSDGWPHVIWIRSRRCSGRRSDMASATSSGSADQEIRDGWQAEVTDKWLRYGNPWEIAKPEVAYYVNRGGRTEWHRDSDGEDRALGAEPRGERHRVRHANSGLPRHQLQHAALVERRGGRVVRLSGVQLRRLLPRRGRGGAPRPSRRCSTRTTSRRPAASALAQQYFFVSCSLQDMLHTLDVAGVPVTHFAERFAVQLNDTHPSIGVAELMRLLVDERQLDWDTSWRITTATFGYTNHTLLPEARRRGRCPCSPCCFRGTSRSTRSTAASSTRCARDSRTTTRARRGCR